MKILRRSALVGTVATVALGFAGCGSQDSDVTASDTSSDSPASEATTEATSPATSSGLPDCESIWTKGANLPGGYSGCSADGTDVPAEVISCSSGQEIVTYDEHFWAVRGKVINHVPAGLEKDAHFRDVLLSCTA